MTHVEDVYELSPMQHGMLFDSVTGNDTGAYLQHLICELEGVVDVPAFERAWQRVVDRHGVLRTSLHWEDQDKPLQVVHGGVELEIEQLDWTGQDRETQMRRVDELLEEGRRQGLDLNEPPLIRVVLIDFGRGEMCLVWCIHHIILEGWSASVLLQEVLTFYRAILAGEELELPTPRPYRDYIAWLQSQDPSEAETYWRERLRGFTEPTPIFGPASAELMGIVRNYDVRDMRISRETTATLKELARREQLTINTFMQGAWAILLSRYSGERDVLYGTMVSGRSAPIPDIQSMVGLFVNMLPSRVSVVEDMRVVDWLRGLQAEQVRMRDFEHLPMVQIKSWSDVPRGRPFFDSLIVFQNWMGSLTVEEWTPDLRCIRTWGYNAGPGMPLGITVSPGDQLEAAITFDVDRIPAADVERMVQHLVVVFEALARDLTQRVGDVPMLTEADRKTLLEEWNDTAADLPTERIHHRFEARAASTPAAPAVVSEDGDLSYAQLDARANQIAHRLRELGVGPGVRVGLCVERSPAMVAGLLGVLKAGGAYVPIDPHYPAERLRFLLEDSGIAVLLTQDSVAGELPEGGPPRVRLEDDEPSLADRPTSAPGVEVAPEDPAYVIYTSGSTGTPKGVVIPHRAIANYVAHAQREFELQPADRVLQFASVSFDTAAEEIWPTLLTGAVLVLRTDDMLGSARDFFEECERRGVTVADLPTAYWHVLVDGMEEDDLAVPEGMRLVILGGEAARPAHVRTWQARVGDRPRLLNTYGPTETTIVATVADITHEPPSADEPMPIGRPIANAQAYVLDPSGRPVPIGRPGELHIGGAGLALGYLDRPDLTAQRFVPNPFAGTVPGASARLYKTGDVVRHRSDGQLVYLGRLDQQVKFRGFRIELEEIESALQQHVGVRESVVLLREDQPGQQRLVAYVRAEAGAAPAEAGELKAFLQQRLPAYMIPSVLVPVDSFPLSTHGKVDRRALPAPELAAGGGREEAGFVAPRNELEVVLAEIWREALGVERVGVHENFFDLGGHSLLLMPVLTQIEKKLGVHLNPGELVLPTLGQLATTIAGRIQEGPTEAAKQKGGLMRKLLDKIRGTVSSGEAG